jgi:hypothetical protein
MTPETRLLRPLQLWQQFGTRHRCLSYSSGHIGFRRKVHLNSVFSDTSPETKSESTDAKPLNPKRGLFH